MHSTLTICTQCPLFLQAFVEVLASNETFSAPMEDTYKKLDIDPSSVTTLDAYLSEYYSQILKKLKEVGAQGRQTGGVLMFTCHLVWVVPVTACAQHP